MSITWRSKNPNLKGNEEEIVALYQKGVSITDIAKQYEAGRAATDSIFINNKIPKRSAKEVVNNKSYVRGSKTLGSEEDKETVIKLYEEGSTLTELGNMFDTSAVTIRKKLLKWGIELRTMKDSAVNAKEKRVKTIVEKYGVDNPMQDPDIFKKSNTNRFKYKEHSYGGRDFTHLQGYEPQAIEYLVEEMGYDVNDIETYSGSSISYYMDGDRRRYHPDLYIAKDDLVIEVKCEYTYENNLDMNISKAKACRKKHKFLCIIFDNKGVKVNKVFN
jgi:hypothetical protein